MALCLTDWNPIIDIPFLLIFFFTFKESNWKFLEKLIESDIDLNRANAKGDYPLELAIKGKTDLYSNQFQMSLLYNGTCDDETNPSKDIIKKMLDKGANPNLTANGKNSPLILAIMKGLDNIVDVLLDNGADICHIGEKKLTTIESALKTSKCVFSIKLTN